MTRRVRVSIRGAAAISVMFLSLVVAGSARAGTYGWEGWLGPGSGNGQCPLYSGQAACTPNWNYWYQINAANKVPPYGADKILAGFETSSVIRGIYLDAGQSGTDYSSSEGMGGWYVKSGATWCSWLPSCAISGYAGDVWFRSYA
jgi:hypothetical protein